jgi:hypothetical protein
MLGADVGTSLMVMLSPRLVVAIAVADLRRRVVPDAQSTDLGRFGRI